MSHRHWQWSVRLLLFIWLLFGSAAAWAESEQNRGANSLSFGRTISAINLITQPVYVAFPEERWIYGLEYGTGTLSADESAGNVDASGDLEVTDFNAFARRFSGNSFNYIIAYTSRTSRADVQATDSKTGGTAQFELNAAVSALTLGMGNWWTFDNGLEVGLDWATASLPMGFEADTKVLSRSGSIETDKVRTKYKDIGRLVNLLALLPTIPPFITIHIGFSF